MNKRALLIGMVLVGGSLEARDAFALPTPQMSPKEMMKVADVVVEGTVTSVTLIKHWIGDQPAVDIGYETGEFESQFLVSKTLKGPKAPAQSFAFYVHAYMEGKWDNQPADRFVYENTGHAITPGTKLRLYLRWDAKEKRYQRVDFNSGFEVLEKSRLSYPKKVGVPSRAVLAKK